jgi:hypothetical protein
VRVPLSAKSADRGTLVILLRGPSPRTPRGAVGALTPRGRGYPAWVRLRRVGAVTPRGCGYPAWVRLRRVGAVTPRGCAYAAWVRLPRVGAVTPRCGGWARFRPRWARFSPRCGGWVGLARGGWALRRAVGARWGLRAGFGWWSRFGESQWVGGWGGECHAICGTSGWRLGGVSHVRVRVGGWGYARRAFLRSWVWECRRE